MKTCQMVLLVVLVTMIAPCASGQGNFNIDEYFRFLESHKDMDNQALLAMYPPPTTYWSRSQSPADLDRYNYLDSILAKYELTEDELASLKERHFVVTERLSFPSMGDAFLDVYAKDLPVFVSTDAILHALHMSFDEILKHLEVSILEPELRQMLDAMRMAYPMLLSRYQSNPQMHDGLADVDLYVTMAASLLEGSPVAPQLITEDFVRVYWEAVQAEQYAKMPLFTSGNRELDLSQFTVRGHYTQSEELSRYFRSMMWLGRMDFLLTPPPISADPSINLSPADILRMHVGAVLLNELLDLSGQRFVLDGMDDMITFLVGESDNLTTGELQEIIVAQGINSGSDLLDSTIYNSFHKAIVQSPFSSQKILSSIFRYNECDKPPELPVSFRLFGQRFIIDSYVFSKVVFPWIRYQNQNVWRPMPEPLDAMVALGNDDAIQLIQDDLEEFKYSSALAGVRYLIDAYDDDFWSSSLYNAWLSSLRELNPPKDDASIPFFMKTTGWHQQKLNTQLASWAQLRHDNLLYAKQSYTGGGEEVCSYPFGYVEPYPQFYHQLGAFAQKGSSYFASLNGNGVGDLSPIVEYFGQLWGISDTLGVIARKELDGIQFDEPEKNFLKRVLTSRGFKLACGPWEGPDGWYARLFFGGAPGELTYREDYIVADVHTQPTDEFGKVVGRILHVGVAKVNLGVYLVEQTHDICPYRAYVGPAMSYYEQITEDFDRLTDERWKSMVQKGEIPPRPDWVSVYLMDGSGSRYPRGRELAGINAVTETGQTVSRPLGFGLSQNYPNPFNPSTTISYQLPVVSDVKLSVFDILGREVWVLVDEKKEPGYHQVRFEGAGLASGVYLYRLQAGEFVATKKLVLVK